MLGLSVNGTFITLAPGTVAQLSRSSPFLTNDVLPGEYSLPLGIVYTEENCLALGLLFSYNTRRQKTSYPNAVLHDGTAIAHRGTLVIEELQSNMNTPRTALLTGYFLCGASTFYAQVKDVLLKDVPLGSRQFTWTTGNPYDGSNGFWQHVHKTWTDSSYGFVFYSVRNEGWEGDGGTVDYMNKQERHPTQARLSYASNFNSLCPHLYLVPLLHKIFEQYGYTLTGDVLQDFDFKLLTLVSFRSVKWKNPHSDNPYASIIINLAEHVPPTKKITDLLIDLQQYFAIAFVVDPATRMVEVAALKNTRTTAPRKDWTQYAEPAFTSNFSNEKSVIALKTEIDPADGFPGSPFDPAGKTILPAIESHTGLDALTLDSNLEKYVFCYRDNTWYQLVADQYTLGAGWLPANTRLYWAPVHYNVHSYEPANATDSTESKISTMAMLWSEHISLVAGQPDFYRLYPACIQEGNWHSKQGAEKEWGFRLLFYRGLTAELTELFGINDPYVPGQLYPFATSTQGGLLPNSLPFGGWSLPYVYTRPGSGYESGVLAYWWRPWLDCLENNSELITTRLWLPRHELQRHRWTDVILIRNVPYLVQSMDETIPYPGYVTAELRRIG